MRPSSIYDSVLRRKYGFYLAFGFVKLSANRNEILGFTILSGNEYFHESNNIYEFLKTAYYYNIMT